MSSRVRSWIDGVALVGVFLTVASGLVLLVAFHVGGHSYQPAALGWSRLAWQNLHRLSSVPVLASVTAHVAIHFRSIGARILRTLRGARVGQDRREILFYVTFSTVVLTGFVVWIVVGGSPPLLGPARLGPVTHQRHAWVDLHFLAGLVSLHPTFHHVRRRWNALRVLVRRALSRSPRSMEGTAA
jgi:hypothetical protein